MFSFFRVISCLSNITVPDGVTINSIDCAESERERERDRAKECEKNAVHTFEHSSTRNDNLLLMIILEFRSHALSIAMATVTVFLCDVVVSPRT